MQHSFISRAVGIKFSGAVLAGALVLATPVYAADLDQEGFNKMMDTYLTNEANVAKVGDSLESYFRNKREQQKMAAEQAEEQRMEEQYKNPVKIDISTSPVKGPADAAVTVVEFSDFQCPFCSRGKDRMEDILKEYPGKVKIAFKHLPLAFHPHAKPAARAAVAAQKQGKFWEMHDELFKNQEQLSEELYPQLAKQIGLDLAKFKADYDSAEVAKQVEDDAALATKLGIQGTPGFFVNGVEVRGARELPYFKKLIDRWLQKKG